MNIAESEQQTNIIAKTCGSKDKGTRCIGAKMTGFAIPNQIMIGQSVYENLDSANKSKFKKVNVSKDEWDYINSSTGNEYSIYGSINALHT